MLLTITYTGENTQNIGFLFRKNPSRPQVFQLSFGKAFVFYPELSDAQTTIALLLDIDPIDLSRGKEGSGGGLFDYVNDRPYVSSSFMSVAISSVFSTAMSGFGDKFQALADAKLRLTATIVTLPCKSGKAALNRVFEPLGYEVAYDSLAPDERFGERGESAYVNLTIGAEVRLCDLLRHIYLLIPVFDAKKHYWIGGDEVDKLTRLGAQWLPNHPEKEFIVRRYLSKSRRLSSLALERLKAAGDETDGDRDDAPEEEKPERLRLNKQRLNAAIAALRESGAKSAIDLGCGEGALLALLLKEPLDKIAACDASQTALQRAKERIGYDRLSETKRQKLSIFQSSLTYKDDRFAGYDAACVIEVIEHIDPARLEAFERSLFKFARPKCAIITTPNREYNEKYENLRGELRHSDHRFEWTRDEFRSWAEAAAGKYGYTASFSDIGEADEKLGAPTQMALFSIGEGGI
ncbi:MAG: 3' terminal RNA ribose 2'-O-methyltransferase Hen1 [Helicobacteraceae bacterium]|jgi:3' terminal RNA ribose 2'-O-methyltransferase Hen1|nr:3' terminal RNA ribose 2'-O-methyltransferase Hen1 [Helicobacteraceae bacterium]